MKPRPLTLALLAASALAACGGGAPGPGSSTNGLSFAADRPIDAPRLLSQSGLYADMASGQVLPWVEAYTPLYPLWADGSGKQRWVRLPNGGKVDTGDMDHWSFPRGTRFWKQFSVNGRPIETRMITRTGTGPTEFSYATYQWNEAGTDAEFVADGVTNALGSGHDIPPVSMCHDCHGRLKEHVLGFNAIQLSHSMAGLNVGNLDQRGLLTMPAPQDYKIPGDAVTAAALGYLHGNCGYCHNPDGIVVLSPYVLRLSVSMTTLMETGAYQTAVGVRTSNLQHPGIGYRITPGDPEQSAIVYRMSVRGNRDQMPPIATRQPDPAGLLAVRTWIESLP